MHNEMLTQGVKKAELARKLDIAPPNIERIFRIRHKPRIETVEAALASLVTITALRHINSSQSITNRQGRLYDINVPLFDRLYDEHLEQLRKEGLILIRGG